MKGPNTKYCLTSKVITTIYALHFSLLVLLSLFFFFFDDLSSFVALVFYRDRVLVGEGVRFEVYLREERVLKGSFWRDYGDEWRLDCKCVLENETTRAEEEAQVKVAVEGPVVMSENVAMVARKKRGFNNGLKEIPEEREVDDDDDEFVCGCDCLSGETVIGSEGRDWGQEMDREDDEMDIEGVRWAVDVGIWVMCLGVGFLVSKAL